jgi:molybdate transport system regulatory protein
MGEMKISARNIFKGKVSHVEIGAVNAEVSVALAGGENITAIVTNGSVKSLGIATGRDILVLVKASSVMVLVDGSGVRLSARNCLAGTVQHVLEGAVDAEVSIRLHGGETVHAVVTKESARALGLKPGVAASAVFKASSVILGVTD